MYIRPGQRASRRQSQKIVQLVSATVDSLTIKISREKVAEYVQNTYCRDQKSQAVAHNLGSSYDHLPGSSSTTGLATSHANDCDWLPIVAAGRAINRGRPQLILR